MKTYTKPTIEFIELKPEERLACESGGSCGGSCSGGSTSYSWWCGYSYPWGWWCKPKHHNHWWCR
ncbi:MAG TPA: hypothetical protein VHT96_11800 [Clostridia bacterium]|nr:hypothetical protein [Clostridia bacterium]